MTGLGQGVEVKMAGSLQVRVKQIKHHQFPEIAETTGTAKSSVPLVKVRKASSVAVCDTYRNYQSDKRLTKSYEL